MQFQREASSTEVLRPAPPPYPIQFEYPTTSIDCPSKFTSSAATSSSLETTPSMAADEGYDTGYVYVQRPEPEMILPDVDCDTTAVPLTPTTTLPTGHYVWQQEESPSTAYFVDGASVNKFMTRDNDGVVPTSDTAAILDLDTNRLLTATSTTASMPTAVQFQQIVQQAGRVGGDYAAVWNPTVTTSSVGYGVPLSAGTANVSVVSQPQMASWSSQVQFQTNPIPQPRDTTVQEARPMTMVAVAGQMPWVAGPMVGNVMPSYPQQQPVQPPMVQSNRSPYMAARPYQSPAMATSTTVLPGYSPSSSTSGVTSAGPGGTWVPESPSDGYAYPLGMDAADGGYGGREDKRARPYHCEVCNKYFIRKGHLNRHLSTSAHRSRLGTLAATTITPVSPGPRNDRKPDPQTPTSSVQIQTPSSDSGVSSNGASSGDEANNNCKLSPDAPLGAYQQILPTILQQPTGQAQYETVQPTNHVVGYVAVPQPEQVQLPSSTVPPMSTNDYYQQQRHQAETYFYVQQHEHQQMMLQQQNQQMLMSQSASNAEFSPDSPFSPSNCSDDSSGGSASMDSFVGSSSSPSASTSSNNDGFLAKPAKVSGKQRLVCPICNKKSSTEVIHNEHMAMHRGDKPYKCTQCPKQFGHKTDLRRHLCLHSGEKPFACGICGKRFIRKDHMTKHVEVHRKEEQLDVNDLMGNPI